MVCCTMNDSFTCSVFDVRKRPHTELKGSNCGFTSSYSLCFQKSIYFSRRRVPTGKFKNIDQVQSYLDSTDVRTLHRKPFLPYDDCNRTTILFSCITRICFLMVLFNVGPNFFLSSAPACKSERPIIYR